MSLKIETAETYSDWRERICARMERELLFAYTLGQDVSARRLDCVIERMFGVESDLVNNLYICGQDQRARFADIGLFDESEWWREDVTRRVGWRLFAFDASGFGKMYLNYENADLWVRIFNEAKRMRDIGDIYKWMDPDTWRVGMWQFSDRRLNATPKFAIDAKG